MNTTSRRLFLRAMGLAVAAPALTRLIAGTAQATPLPRSGEARVKELEWQDYPALPHIGLRTSSHQCSPAAGVHFRIDQLETGGYGVGAPGMWGMWGEVGQRLSYPTLDAAKAAAQSHWNSMVLGALESES